MAGLGAVGWPGSEPLADLIEPGVAGGVLALCCVWENAAEVGKNSAARRKTGRRENGVDFLNGGRSARFTRDLDAFWPRADVAR